MFCFWPLRKYMSKYMLPVGSLLVEPERFIPLKVVLRQLTSTECGDVATMVTLLGVPGRSPQPAWADPTAASVSAAKAVLRTHRRPQTGIARIA